jgi:antitoxin component HigA of HigAB toxin-antitoxin module|nr:MAG TPA: SOS-response transcriptional repressor [Siphoviridae sp. ctvS314]
METNPLAPRLVRVIIRQIQEQNLSVLSVAEETGIPIVTLHRRLNSHGRGLTVDEVDRIATYFKTSPAVLISQAEAIDD